MTPRERAENKGDPFQMRQSGSLEQVRELLFGAIYRELERRLARADANLATRSEELQIEAKRRTELLEAHLTREIETLVARLDKEHVTQVEALARSSREHRESTMSLEQRVEKLEESLVGAQRELRQEMLAQTNRFLDELHRTRNELMTTLDRELALLNQEPELPQGTEAEVAPAPH